MPSSMIFASLVVLWLLILVPAVARHRQEVARPSVAALSGRVLERPRQRQGPGPGREPEVDVMDDLAPAGIRRREDDPAPADDEQDSWGDEEPGSEPDDRRWERPPPRFRPGRGGFDPEAAAIAARARYAFRQRVVLAMIIVAIVTGVVAAVAVPGLWWPHAAVDLVLVGYLVYLRRQVQLEESIRERRASRMAGTHRPSAAEDPELDEWARRGRDVTGRYDDGDPDAYDDRYDAEIGGDPDGPDAEADDERTDDLAHERPERVRGTGEPVRRQRAGVGDGDETGADPVEGEPALPRLRPAPPPPLPAGTALVEAHDDDLELRDLEGPARPDYRRAAGE